MINFIKSFGFAFTGLFTFFRYERNGKIQLLAAVIATIAGGLFKISLHEWMWMCACIVTVLSFEMMNTAIEKICNMVQPEYHPAVKAIKDIAAAAVLLAAMASVVIGALIFLPKILDLL
ncbi:MAG: diacylglycerol kinase [Segetibacter sp.]|nr:diacylglycerol kinase [Segetibacter sp.]